jgi:hypothetical protein
MLSLCKKEKNIKIEYFGEQKFLSNGHAAAYIGECAPEWTAEDCVIALDLDEETRDKFDISEEHTRANEELIPDDFTKVEKLVYSLNVLGVPLQPFTLNGKVFFVDMELMRVFRDEENKRFYYGEIGKKRKKPKLIIESNGIIVGIIEVEIINIDTMEEFTKELRAGVQRAKEECFNVYGGQISIEE